MAAPGDVPTQVAFSQERRYEALDLTGKPAYPYAEHAYLQRWRSGGAVGNLAVDGSHREDRRGSTPAF